MESTRKVTCSPEDWVRLYADDFYRFALIKVSDHTLAQDLVQDTFLSALQALPQFRGDSSEKTWLLTILRNKITDHFRKTGRNIVSQGIEQNRTDNDPYHFFFDKRGHWHPGKRPTAWDPALADPEKNELLQVMQRCLQQLTGMGKTVISLKFLEEKKSDDICKELSLSASYYWVIIHRAKLQLRACLEKNWFNN